MKLSFLSLLLLPALARAQAWRADLELSQPDALLLVVAICGGLAFYWIKAPGTREQRTWRLLACVALGIAAIVWPPARGLVALLAVAFLVYGFVRRT